MGISMLTESVKNNEIIVRTFSKNGKHGFKIYREIARSEEDYFSKENAEIAGSEIAYDLKNGEFKDVSDDEPTSL